MFCSFVGLTSEGAGTEASRRRRVAVADASLSRMAPRSLSHNGIRSGPSLPWMIVGAGHVSPYPYHRGSLYGFPQSNMYAAGSKEEKQAGGPLPGGTIAQSFLFCNGGGALPGRRVLLWPAPSFSGGSGLACAAIPPAPPSDVFRNRGTPPVPPAGAAPPAPRLWSGREVAHRDAGHDCASVALSRDYTTIALHALQSQGVLLQQRVWFGLRRYPARSTLRRF